MVQTQTDLPKDIHKRLIAEKGLRNKITLGLTIIEILDEHMIKESDIKQIKRKGYLPKLK